jgi:hypothetical protein
MQSVSAASLSLLTSILTLFPSEMMADPWEYRHNSCRGESLVDIKNKFASKTLQIHDNKQEITQHIKI